MTRPLVADLDLEELFATAQTTPWGIADFITPSPTEPQADFVAELEKVRQADPSQILVDLAELASMPAHGRIRTHPRPTPPASPTCFRAYWDIAWPRTGRAS